MPASFSSYSVVDTDIPLLPPADEHKREPNGRELTALYSYNGEPVYVSCSYSACRTKCVFSSSEFGEAMFDRWNKLFLSSTRAIEEDYIRFLGRTLNQWEKQFNDFDLQP